MGAKIACAEQSVSECDDSPIYKAPSPFLRSKFNRNISDILARQNGSSTFELPALNLPLT